MISRTNQIVVACGDDKRTREQILQQSLVAAGFARTRSDARKIIKTTIADYNLDSCFFVFLYEFNFRENLLLTNRLIKLAMQGVPIFVSSKSIPNGILQFCRVVHKG